MFKEIFADPLDATPEEIEMFKKRGGHLWKSCEDNYKIMEESENENDSTGVQQVETEAE